MLVCVLWMSFESLFFTFPFTYVTSKCAHKLDFTVVYAWLELVMHDCLT